MIELIKQYPGAVFILLIVMAVISIGIIVYAVLKGRFIKTPWFEIGGKEQEKKEKQTLIQRQTQNVNIYPNTMFTDDQLSEVAKKIASQIPKFQSEIAKDPDLLYHPPVLKSRIIYLHAAVNDFTSKLALIVTNEAGGWAGISMAGFGTFLDKAVNFKLLPDDLVEKLYDFTTLTQFYLHAEDISDSTFLDIQYLATNINRGLDEVITKMPRKFSER